MKRHVAFGLLVLGVAALARNAPAEDRALLVGVGNYKDTSIRSLPGITTDLGLMKQVALQSGFKDSQIKVLLNSQATLAEIKNGLATWLTQGVRPQDRVLFYFSGHGSVVADNAAGEVEGVDSVLAPYDTERGDGTLGNVLLDDVFGGLLSKNPSHNVLVIIDACNSGTVTLTSTKSIGTVSKLLEYPGMPKRPSHLAKAFYAKDIATINHVLLAACKDYESAGATDNGSVLTVAVSKAVADLKAHSQAFTVNAVLKTVQQEIAKGNNPQHPMIAGSLSLADYNWFETVAVAGDPTTKTGWEQLETFAAQATFTVQVNGGQAVYGVGDPMELQIEIPKPGYLNVVTYGEGDADATVLFPNRLYQKNEVSAGTFKLPNSASYKIRQGLPAGATTQKCIVVAVFSEQPVNFFDQGVGTGMYKMLPSQTERHTRSPEVVPGGEGFGAGRITFEIHRK